jgi:beta-lactamase superfamily II metal-dependent hydrolase
VLACLGTFLVWARANSTQHVPTPGKSSAKRAVLRVDFLAVGHGDSALITSPTGKTVLIDGGLEEAGATILSFLRGRNACPVDLVLLTHRHADHLGGLVRIIEACGARLYLDAPYPHDSAIYAKLLDALESRQVSVRQAERGRIVDLGDGARLLLLGPPSPFLAEGSGGVNANSVVTRLDYGKGSVLFAADAEELAENWLLASGADLRATVLKVGHHGSRHSSSPQFLHSVLPKIAVISTEAGDPHHPHVETLQRLAQVGAQVFRTDVDGQVTLGMDGESVTVHSRTRTEVVATP